MSIPPRIVDGDFAGWLRDAIAERGVSTRQLELRTGLDHTTIYRLMRGERDPQLSTALILLRALEPRHGRSISRGASIRAASSTVAEASG